MLALVKSELISAHQLARIIGKLSAAISAVQPAPLHYRNLQHLKHRVLRQRGYDQRIQMTKGARADLQWWLDNLRRWNRREVKPRTTGIEIETDAPQRGWGAYCNCVHTVGFWDARLFTSIHRRCSRHCTGSGLLHGMSPTPTSSSYQTTSRLWRM